MDPIIQQNQKPEVPQAGWSTRQIERQSALMEADRLMMMIVQTSLSLIGFGFTINAFFTGVAKRGVALGADVAARRLGLAMLCLGLLFLSMGVCNQAMYRRALARRYRDCPKDKTAVYSAAASFTVALLLLLIGFVAFGFAVLRAA